MNKLDQLKTDLSKFGDVQVCKETSVFTLFMTGENMSNSTKVAGITMLLQLIYEKKYPFIETMVNDETYFLLILKRGK